MMELNVSRAEWIRILPSAFNAAKKRKKTRSNADHFKQRFRKTFTTLLEELVSCESR